MVTYTIGSYIIGSCIGYQLAVRNRTAIVPNIVAFMIVSPGIVPVALSFYLSSTMRIEFGFLPELSD